MSFYFSHDHENWLICYMPVVKPSPSDANLAVVPLDTLAKRDPRTFEWLRNRGAVHFEQVAASNLDKFRMCFPEDDVQIGDWYAIDDYHDSTIGCACAAK